MKTKNNKITSKDILNVALILLGLLLIALGTEQVQALDLSGLNTNLSIFYNMDESSGSPIDDGTGRFNMSVYVSSGSIANSGNLTSGYLFSPRYVFNVSNDARMNFGTGDFTIAWAGTIDASKSDPLPLGKDDNAVANLGWYFYRPGTGNTIHFYLRGGTAVSIGSGLDLSKVNYFFAIRNGSNVYLAVYNSSGSWVYSANQTLTSNEDNTNPLTLGCLNTAEPTLCHQGRIIRFGLWAGRSLNLSEREQVIGPTPATGFSYAPFTTGESPALNYGGGTTANGTSEFYYLYNLTINTTSQYFAGVVNTSHYVYNSSGTLIRQFNETNGDGNYTSSLLFTSPGNYSFNASAYNGTSRLSLGSYFISLNSSNAFLNITIKNGLNLSVLPVNGTINATFRSFDNTSTSWTILNGYVGPVGIVKTGIYELFLDAPGYSYVDYNFTASSSYFQYLNLSLFSNNSVNIRVLDESSGAYITQNITITFTSGSEYIYSTTNGSLFVDNLPDGSYSVVFSSANYSLKTYNIVVASRSYQNLDAYLSASSQNVVFTILDYDSSIVLPGATITQAKLINSSWTTLDSKTADITGRAQLSYIPGTNYRFIVSYSGYSDNIFYLNPVLFSTYNVRLQKTTTLSANNTPSFLGVDIVYYPVEYLANETKTFYWTITSPQGTLVSYNLFVNWTGGSFSDSGNLANGETFTFPVNISPSVGLDDKLRVYYCYQPSTAPSRCFVYYHDITGGFTENSFKALGNNTFGLGLLERTFLVVALVVISSGVAFYFAGPLAGLPIALFLFGYFYYTGFLPLWLILIPAVGGVVLIIWRSSE